MPAMRASIPRGAWTAVDDELTGLSRTDDGDICS
jgi:hypothetical protein